MVRSGHSPRQSTSCTRSTELAAQLASAALIGFGGVGKAVAQYPATILQSRHNDLGELLRPRGEHQGHFGQRIQPGGARIQQHRANAFADFGSARLASGQHLDALGAQHFRQLLQLGALAAAVEAFEGDELSALDGFRHGVMISVRTSRLLRSVIAHVSSARLRGTTDFDMFQRTAKSDRNGSGEFISMIERLKETGGWAFGFKVTGK